jgi:serralysin
MPSYTTLDHLPDLTSSDIAQANTRTLSWTIASPNSEGWDYQAYKYDSADYALLRATFSFQAVAGATYDFSSSSWFDPFLLRVYDHLGNTIAADSGGGTYGYDFILDWVAPYTGTFYVNASWDQGSYYDSCSILITEDRDTISRTVVTGTSASDSLIGGNGNEDIYGGAGNDTLSGGGNDDFLVGDQGTDIVVYAAPRWHFHLSKIGADKFHIRDDAPDRHGVDILLQVERLQFADGNLALDVSGNAGLAARALGALLGPAAVSNAQYVGIALNLLDTGSSLQQLMSYGIAEVMPGSTSQDVVSRIYTNVVGTIPSAATVNSYAMVAPNADALAQLAADAAMSVLNANRIGLTGLMEIGIPYL